MAQAVFEDHPLEAYLRRALTVYFSLNGMWGSDNSLSAILETGEIHESMPGAAPDLLGHDEQELLDQESYEDVDVSLDDLLELVPQPLLQLFKVRLPTHSLFTLPGREASQHCAKSSVSS
jgi:hypothetical protein